MINRYISPVPLPTAFEAELLDILKEECMEVAQRAIKTTRFGVEETQSGQEYTNKQRLSREIGQLRYMIYLADWYGLIDEQEMNAGYFEKPRQLERYMQQEPPEGWGKTSW